jgi:hypothetical protein
MEHTHAGLLSTTHTHTGHALPETAVAETSRSWTGCASARVARAQGCASVNGGRNEGRNEAEGGREAVGLLAVGSQAHVKSEQKVCGESDDDRCYAGDAVCGRLASASEVRRGWGGAGTEARGYTNASVVRTKGGVCVVSCGVCFD